MVQKLLMCLDHFTPCQYAMKLKKVENHWTRVLSLDLGKWCYIEFVLKTNHPPLVNTAVWVVSKVPL